jgi:hypothetical protein
VVLSPVIFVGGGVRGFLHSGRITDLTAGHRVSSADYAAYQLRPTDCGDADAV